MRRWTAVTLGLALLAAGCAGAPPATRTAASAAVDDQPWRIPAAQENRQFLFRMQVTGDQGGASLRTVLRLVTAERYELVGSDLLGRPLWTVDAADGLAVWNDHRTRSSCPLGDQLRLPDLGLPAMAPNSLPALLLGRLPAEPATAWPAGPENLGATNELRDAKGRRWTWREAQGALVGWTLWQGAEPAVWWRREGAGGVLSARRERAQVRWQVVVSEPLPAPLGAPAIPAGYTAGDCDALALP